MNYSECIYVQSQTSERFVYALPTQLRCLQLTSLRPVTRGVSKNTGFIKQRIMVYGRHGSICGDAVPPAKSLAYHAIIKRTPLCNIQN